MRSSRRMLQSQSPGHGTPISLVVTGKSTVFPRPRRHFLPDLFPLQIPQHTQAIPIRILHRAGTGLSLFSEATSVTFKNAIDNGGTAEDGYLPVSP